MQNIFKICVSGSWTMLNLDQILLTLGGSSMNYIPFCSHKLNMDL